ncbi:MAG: hypothetical protein GX434_17145 [Peptococcaceae bacterium]|nr:hypothetical protein [Peptococcaceae bacterium]
MLFGKGDCSFHYRKSCLQRRINIPARQAFLIENQASRVANQAVPESTGSDPQTNNDLLEQFQGLGKKILISQFISQLASQLISQLISQLFNQLSGRNSPVSGDPSLINRTNFSSTTNVTAGNGVEVTVDPAGNDPETRKKDCTERGIERILIRFPIGRTTTIGFENGFYTGLWGGFQDEEAKLTNAQLYNNSGKAIGTPQDITGIPISEITFVV